MQDFCHVSTDSTSSPKTGKSTGHLELKETFTSEGSSGGPVPTKIIQLESEHENVEDNKKKSCSCYCPTKNPTAFFFPEPVIEHPRADQWFWLAFWIILPGAVTFTYSVCATLYHKQWWSIAYNLPYNSSSFTIATVFEIHFIFAIIMLVGIVSQLTSVYISSDNSWWFHGLQGNGIAMVIIMALIPGIIGLAVCDSSPKRGVEAVFFVQLGICIVLTTVKAYTVIKSPKLTMVDGELKETAEDRTERHQTHMKYMVWNLMMIFSPAYNRLWQIFWRNVNHWKPECYKVLTFTMEGVLYTPSFIIALAYSLFMWAFIFRYPLFKFGESGWWQFWFFGCSLVLCIVQMTFFWSNEYNRIHDCSHASDEVFAQMMNGTIQHSFFAMNMEQGVCNSRYAQVYVPM